ncbi:MAG: zinc-binding dehydrogenase [Cytophagales bacterium]|uniref:quinone oxidoreductase family protein n=1 Tax=Cyclobacterium marinum TaxID=104 RepID=UPI0030DA7034|nr:zinc-binding dehydrogenase [Cytophagales bacterium]|tara:strand:- start:39745 stop:40767 length:1023 start_codon:yes stop_codon:yes gene_type:complete
MKQATIVEYGPANKAFKIQEASSLVPKENEVQIEVEGFGLNYADVMARNGLYKEAPKLPFVPGYEVVGKVKKAGAKVPVALEGKRVVAFTRFGGYATEALADYKALGVISDEISGGEACALATQYCTAYYMSHYFQQVRKGEIALIHACAGGVGTALTQLCQLKGVTVVGLCSTTEKMDYLRDLKVDYPINYKETDYKDWIIKNLGKRSIDHVFNAVAGNSFKRDLKLLNYGGKLFCFGGAARSGQKDNLVNDLSFLLKTGFISPLFMMMKAQAVIGVNMLRFADHKVEVIGTCLNELIMLYENKKIAPKVGGNYSIENLAEAHASLESGKSTGKIYVYW